MKNLRNLAAALFMGIAFTFGIWAMASDTKPAYPPEWDQDPGPKAAHCTICHRPPGNPPNEHTLTIGCPGADAHLRNHALDCTGPCPCYMPGGNP